MNHVKMGKSMLWISIAISDEKRNRGHPAIRCHANLNRAIICHANFKKTVGQLSTREAQNREL